MQLHRCFECFVVRNHENKQIKTSHKGSRMKNLRLRVLRRLLKTIQDEEKLFQIPKSFQREERSKMGRKHKTSNLRGCLTHPCTYDIIPCCLGAHAPSSKAKFLILLFSLRYFFFIVFL